MSKREEVRTRRRQQERNQRLILIGIVGVFALVIAGLLIIPNLPKSVGEIKVPEARTFPQAKGNSMGDPNAPVKVEEYADFQCPYCAQYAFEIEPKLTKDFIETGKVYYTYYSLSFIGPESKTASEYAYCAMDQEKFWEYRDIVYANQNGENKGWFTSARLLAYGEKVGLDKNKLSDCVNSGKYKAKIDQDLKTGNDRGVTATPSFFVNGKLVYMDTITKTIEDAVAGK
jgi:protein-disulfide isomerase